MFTCNNCKRKFTIPDKVKSSYEEDYGVSHLFPDKHFYVRLICPECGSDDFEEIEVKNGTRKKF